MSRFGELRSVMDRLREPGGCPWDRAQRLEDLRGFVIEEAYEVVDAIDRGDHDHLREELGDLLLQVVFLARVESEEGRFDVEDVIAGIVDKLVRRHPHVFGGTTAGSPGEALQQWERIKNAEGRGGDRRLLDGVPRSLPALLRAHRLSAKAALAGFDWQKQSDLQAKVREEVEEFLAEARAADVGAMARELGDLLFVLANVARHAGIDPEAALQGANERFRRRFGHIEESLHTRGTRVEEAGLEEMEALWEEAKRREDATEDPLRGPAPPPPGTVP